MDYTLFLQLVFDAFRALLWPVLGGVVTFVVLYQKQKTTQEELDRCKTLVTELGTKVQDLAVQNKGFVALEASVEGVRREISELKEGIGGLKKEDRRFLELREEDRKFLHDKFADKEAGLRGHREVMKLIGDIFKEIKDLQASVNKHLGAHEHE